MNLRTTQIFRRDFFSGSGLDKRWPAQKDCPVSLHNNGFVGHAWYVSAAGRTRPANHCYLRDCLCRHVRLVEKYPSKVFLIGKDSSLLRQKGPAAVYQIDARQIVLQRNLLCTQVLLDCDRIVGPAFDRGIVGNHHAKLTGNHSDSSDNSATRNPVHVSGKSREFQERGSGIAQCLHPVPWQEFVSLEVAFDGFRSASLSCMVEVSIELVHLLPGSFHGLLIGFGVAV
mmetsp:Transcript_16687/g.38301  ORF Transcript_16687/g.38301 Transcript_16687/m.38301 type:complete len:228 (-) Transcript_16687:334-1017(-)